MVGRSPCVGNGMPGMPVGIGVRLIGIGNAVGKKPCPPDGDVA
jgi:hypothetical protein